MKTNNIYLLYSCNEWKEYSSMRLIMASTNLIKIKREIKKRIKNDEFEYDGKYSMKEEIRSIMDKLEYGHVSIVENGEVQ